MRQASRRTVWQARRVTLLASLRSCRCSAETTVQMSQRSRGWSPCDVSTSRTFSSINASVLSVSSSGAVVAVDTARGLRARQSIWLWSACKRSMRRAMMFATCRCTEHRGKQTPMGVETGASGYGTDRATERGIGACLRQRLSAGAHSRVLVSA